MKRLVQVTMALLLVWLLSPHAVAHARPQDATITVDTNNDSDLRDGELSLREAIELANGDLQTCLSSHEIGRAPANWLPAPYPSCGWDASTYPRWNLNITLPEVGKDNADSIVFTSDVSTINISSPMPPVGQSDNIDGGGASGGKVTLDGTGAGSGGGLQVSDLTYCAGCPTWTSNQFVNLVIRNFPGAGIRIDGQHADGVVLQGLEIYDNGGDGIHMAADIFHNPRNTQIGGASVSQRNSIYANGGHGIVFIGTNSYDTGSNFNNRIENTYIGVKPDGSTQAANVGHGIYFQNMRGNTIGGLNPLQANVVSGNGQAGMYLTAGGSTGNIIQNNTVGLNYYATAKVGNGGSGIALVGGAHDNTIGNNRVAGNGQWGIYIGDANSNNNVVTSNYIGTNTASDAGLGNAFDGVYITNGAQFNQIGVSDAGNWVAGNGGDGVKIHGSGADHNTVRGNNIGLNAALNARRGNTYNGVTIAGGAKHNIIGGSGVGEGNVIAGNGLHGIGMYDANTNANGVYSNTIGTNPSSAGGLGNAGEGVHLETGPTSNEIGLAGAGNLISGNAHDGVQLGGSGTNSNLVNNNTIGLSASRTSALPNGYSGVAIFGGASNNVIGFSGGNGNVIAGNGSDGIYIANAGTDGNNVYANYIGTNPAGAAGLGNAYDGISMYNGTTNNIIGGVSPSAYANYIAGNGGVGVAIGDAGTAGNAVLGNAIGTVDFVTPLPNSMGIGLTGGTTYNSIIGNYIAGNTTHGVGLYNTGTMSNTVQLNLIGWFFTAIGNGMNGVVIQESASANTIDQNLIISNGQNGVYLNSAGTMNNVISNNVIGTNSGGGPGFGNAGHGILFDSGATNNSVFSGTIAYNNGGGIAAMPGSNLNTFLRLNEFSNAGLGIDLLTPPGPGCTVGGGGNFCDPPPVIGYATATIVRGSAAYKGARIDVYVSDGDPSGYGEGRYWLTSVTTDGATQWTATLSVNICATYGTTAKVTATTTSSKGGTSEYARNFPACNKSFLPLVKK